MRAKISQDPCRRVRGSEPACRCDRRAARDRSRIHLLLRSEAHRWLIVGAISRRWAADRVLENRYRPAELPERLTTLGAVVKRCVCCGAMDCSVAPNFWRAKTIAGVV